MSIKFFFVVFVLTVLVIISSVLIGTSLMGDVIFLYVPSEQVLTTFELWSDGSWELKLKNDHSQNITLNSLFISVNDIKVNSSLSNIIPSQGLLTLNSDMDTRTSGGIANFNYLVFINLVYRLGNNTVTTTRQRNSFFKQI